MLNLNQKGPSPDDERVFSRRRILVAVVGAVIAIFAGWLAVTIYTSIRYGDNEKNDIFSGRKPSPSAGKLAYDKNTNLYIGIVKSEGYSTRRQTEVYYIERAGGELIELPKSLVDVRDARTKQR